MRTPRLPTGEGRDTSQVNSHGLAPVQQLSPRARRRMRPKAPEYGALVRLRRRTHSRVKVPVRRNVHPPVTEGYCAVATRGGELPEVNHRSVTT
jgi:hypothetical protein